jgi:hypothetical protein
MLLQFYLINGGSGDYYELGFEGDRGKIETFLHSISKDVRYVGEKDWGRKDKMSRKYAEGVVCRACKFKFHLTPLRDENEYSRQDFTRLD